MAQLDDDIPAEPDPAPPYEGAGSDVDGRLLLSLAQDVEFMGSLHPREISILQMGKIRGVDFDEIRTASVALHFGQDRIADPYLLARYECFRELYVAPLTTGQGLLMRELAQRPEMQSLDALVAFSKANLFNWNFGFLMNADFQIKLRDSALQDLHGKICGIELIEVASLTTSLYPSVSGGSIL